MFGVSHIKPDHNMIRIASLFLYYQKKQSPVAPKMTAAKKTDYIASMDAF